MGAKRGEREKCAPGFGPEPRRILNEQNKYITLLREEHNGQTLKQRWTPKGGDA